jgi:hypothetical protein
MMMPQCPPLLVHRQLQVGAVILSGVNPLLASFALNPVVTVVTLYMAVLIPQPVTITRTLRMMTVPVGQLLPDVIVMMEKGQQLMNAESVADPVLCMNVVVKILLQENVTVTVM